MDNPKSPAGSMRRHGRNISYPMIRRSTKGPLDAPDSLLGDTPGQTDATRVPLPTSPEETRQAIPPFAEPAVVRPPKPNVDLRFLQDPNIYHPLPTNDILPVFLNSDAQPPPGTPLADLLQHGHFRLAAGSAAKQLIDCAPNDAEHIFALLYTRLACLILVSRPDLAAQEAVPMIDLLARNSPSVDEIVPLIPWELRLLLVRLQSIGTIDDGRRGIMALYALAAEVRAYVKQAQADGDDLELKLWADRLRDLGLRVSDALVEMGELETASRHLETLLIAETEEVVYRKALLRLRVGDVAGAQHCVDSVQDDERRAALHALLEVADGESSNGTNSWQHLMEQHPGQPLLVNNLAVSGLYTGHIIDSRRLLEEAAERLPGFPGLLFNLGTVYELCTERAVDAKTKLAQTMASKTPTPAHGGWEKTNQEFKL